MPTAAAVGHVYALCRDKIRPDIVWVGSRDETPGALGGNRILEVNITSGAWRVLVGFEGRLANIDGNATTAAIYYIQSMAMTPDGARLLVKDYYAAIREVDVATGDVTTVVGQFGVGTSHAGLDGYGTNARFARGPGDIVITSDGSTAYFADANFHIRSIDLASGTYEVKTVLKTSNLECFGLTLSPDDKKIYWKEGTGKEIKGLNLESGRQWYASIRGGVGASYMNFRFIGIGGIRMQPGQDRFIVALVQFANGNVVVNVSAFCKDLRSYAINIHIQNIGTQEETWW